MSCVNGVAAVVTIVSALVVISFVLVGVREWPSFFLSLVVGMRVIWERAETTCRISEGRDCRGAKYVVRVVLSLSLSLSLSSRLSSCHQSSLLPPPACILYAGLVPLSDFLSVSPPGGMYTLRVAAVYRC